MQLKLLFATAFTSLISFAQDIPEDIKPPSWNITGLTEVKPYDLPSFDLKKLQNEDKVYDKDKSKPWRFGHDIFVNHDFNEVGEWTILENGDKIWKMSYYSKGALTLNFIFDVFKIPVGSKLYVYNDKKDDLLRPFTHHNNNPEEVLGTWLVEGNQAWIEYYEPANVSGEAKITIGSVVHGYRTAESYQRQFGNSRDFGDAGDCHYDVDCDISPTTDPFEINTRKEEIKRAAGIIVVGTGFCSGTLVNNTNNDATPYFLTARHCFVTSGIPVESCAFRFNWRSPNPSCGTSANSTNGSFNQTVSGSILRASSSQSDMFLIEITDSSFFTENETNLVWAGWNRSTSQLPTVNFGIHHPAGDIQKVCRDDDGATRIETFFIDNPTAQMWLINEWELGVVEQGSSGSGLFNENGHLIGLLSGGTAQDPCVGNGGSVIYGRLGVAWDFGSTASSRLSDWLDPGNTGAEVIDPLDPSLNIDDFSLETSLRIYPNPARNFLNISLTNLNEDLDYQIFNTIGQSVSKGSLESNREHIIDMSQYQSGIYFVKLSTAYHSLTRKVIKE